MTYSDMTLSAINAALLAGAFLKENFQSSHIIHSKEGKQNLVTECDLAAEDRILSSLKKAYPHHGFLAEETGRSNLSSEVVWIIDPLDGTVNFARNIPVFSVSIAACLDGSILLGVIFQPMTGELFVAEKGKGAFLNNNTLKVSQVNNLDSALLVSGFPYNVDENPKNCIEVFSSFLRRGSPIRRSGSAAMDLAYVSAGRYDSYWETGIKPWDVAAGILLVQEAGGMVSKWDGTPYSVFIDSEILGSNTLLHSIMINAIKKESL